jgi:hypothetical protein
MVLGCQESGDKNEKKPGKKFAKDAEVGARASRGSTPMSHETPALARCHRCETLEMEMSSRIVHELTYTKHDLTL